MKSLLFFLLMIASSLSYGQFNDTRWKGTFNVPDPTECILVFSKDSMNLLSENGDVLESMKYRVSGDTIYYVKLFGVSPCYYDTEAAYDFRIKENKLFLSAVKDDCEMRKMAFPEDGLQKIEQ